MKPTLSFAAFASALLVAACSSLGSSGSGAQGANQTQWKEVTRLEGGQFVTYRVPVNQQVNNNVNFHSFDASATPAQSGSTSAGSAAQAGRATTAPGVDTSKTPPLLPTVGSSGDVTPLFGASVAAAGNAGAAAGNAGVAAGSSPAAAVGSTAAPRPNLSGEAETTLGQAEIAVRDAQSRYETAKAALNRAHHAAATGDSVVVIEFARSAITLAQPGH
ncbi:MAG TPA: hypothetical protein VFJ93_09110 [Gaiellaceae bacterium]|nr:hypothetical protein [Gaiellaceae bacterium]